MTDPRSKVVTRFPPSPTGFLQMGNVRTLIYNYLLARQNNGIFMFRIEDTDKARSTKEYERILFENMQWLGFSWDNKDVWRQSERGDVYTKYLERLIREGRAYVSKEEVREEGQRPEVIRFKNPNKTVTFTDLIRGEISFDTTELGDFIIAKSLAEPIYHLAVVIDDFESGITHVIRGEDHISNTPRQILIQEAIGAPRPIYAHLPLILAEDRSKLSKRKHGEAVSLKYYIEKGYLPGAIINYMAMLGWNPGTDQEIFTLEELIRQFDISKVQKGGAVFNVEKLTWVNKEHMKRLPQAEMQKIATSVLSKTYRISNEIVQKLTPLLLERASTFGEMEEMVQAGELDYFFNEPAYDARQLLWKGQGELAGVKEKLQKVLEFVHAVEAEAFNRDAVKAAVWDYASEVGRGEVLWPMRVALSGKDKSPDPFVLSELLGKEETLVRLATAISKTSA